MNDNDGRVPIGTLEKVELPIQNAVVELTDAKTGELIYCHRVQEDTFEAPVFRKGIYTLKSGLNYADTVLLDQISIK